MVGSTELLTSLGDDANDEVRRVLLAALEREVREHRGTVIKSMGDGMMVSFRASAADAVACAAAMQRAMMKLEREGAPLALELRVGISSGEAAYEGGDWFGTPVVEAARLEAAASPGQILVSEVVRSIVGTRGGAQFRSAGTRELKGFARPVPVVEVLWRDASTPRPVKRKTQRRRSRRTLVAGAALIVVAGAALAVTLVFVLRDSGQATDTTGASLPLVAEGYVPKLEPRDCPPELHRDPDVRCQNLIVPEDRAIPTGRQVRILVTVAPATSQQAGVPLVNIGALSGTAGASDLRKYADVVGIGVRGTQFSEPTLTCPEVANVQRRILGLPTNGPEANALFLDAAQQCGGRLASEGVDLSAYGDNAIADDVRDLAIAMDWRQINVEGAAIFSAADQLSFLRTSHTAILIAAGYPGLVHAVVLGQPYPPQARPSDITGYNAALQGYYAACHADAACERAFPGLEQAVLASLARDRQKPAVIMTADPAGGPDIAVMVDGDRNVVGLVSVLGHPGAYAFVASTVFQGERGLPALAAWLVQQTPLDPETPWGAYFSEYCEIDAQQPLPGARTEAAALQYPLFGVFARDPYLKLCARWPTKPPAGAISRFETAIQAPALIITGELDPISPRDYAQAAANVFRDATVAVFPSLTDLFADKELEVGPPCIAALRLAFLRDPRAKLDVDGCIAKVPPIAFVGT
jgi:pimeloyl-ACP methyl ester carboxylesterase